MSDFIQPEELDTEGFPDDLPFDAFPLADLDDLGIEATSAIFAAYSVEERIRIARLHREYQKGREHDAEVDIRVRRMRADRAAREQDRIEREAYLSSPEGLAEAAEAFAENIGLDDLEDPEPIIEGFLNKDTLVRTFGPPKSLKSFVTLDMAACVSLGQPWMGAVTVKQKVLYVVAEGGRGMLKRRDAWNEHHETKMEVVFYNQAVQIGDPKQMFGLIAYCLTQKVGYVIFDTQARCTVGVNENDNTEMGEIVAALDVLKQRTGACVHVVHHSVGSDDTKARGATAFDGAVDTEFAVKRDKNDRDRVRLVSKFQKDVEEADDVDMLTIKVGKSLVLTGGTGGGSTPAATGEVAPALVSDANAFYLEAIRRFGNQDVTVTDVTDDFKDRQVVRSRSAIKKAFGALQGNGAIEPAGKGTAVRLTQAGLVFSDGWRKKQAEGNLWDGQGALEDPPDDD